MLVLSRKKNESIVINDEITVVVLEIRGDKVRLGVEAPREIPVHRNEVQAAIDRAKQTTGGHGQDVNAGSEALPPASTSPPNVADAALGESSFNN